MKQCGRVGYVLCALLPLAAADAGSLREAAEFDAVYTGEVWRNQRGGLRTGSAYLDNLDATLAIDAERWLGWEGGRWFVYGLYNNGGSTSATYSGDAQGVSNLETVRAARVYEFWYEQSLMGGTASLRTGLYDLNSEFYATASSGLFIHPAQGIGTDFSQSGEAGPSIFSITGLGLRWQHDVDARWGYRAVILDAVPGDPDHPDRTVVELRGEEGALLAAEVDLHPGTYRVGLGGWHYTKRQPRLDGDGTAISRGSYGFAELALRGDTLEGAPVRVFLRGGLASDEANRFGNFMGGGVVLAGRLWGRADDEFGLACARARNGSPYRNALAADGFDTTAQELELEMTYRFALSERIKIQPDIQYIIDPDTRRDLDDVLVLGLRMEVVLN